MKINLARILDTDYSLQRKLISRNSKNCYISTSISSCNTSRKDGLLVCKNSEFSESYQVLLSYMDEVVMNNSCHYKLGFHKYPECFYPEGLKYILKIKQDPHISYQYAMSNIILQKELFLSPNKPELICKYTLKESKSEIELVLKPLLAFRNIYSLNKSRNKNFEVNFRNNRLKVSESKDYPELFFSFSKEVIFTETLNWYNNFEYIEDKQKGQEYNEDLFLPGQLIVSLKEKESFTVTIGLEEIENYGKLKYENLYASENVKHLVRN